MFHLFNPSEEVKLEAVKSDGRAIQFINNPSEELKMIAVKENGLSIEYIRNPSLQIQLEAVKQNIKSIFYIKNPDKETAFYCITSNPDLLKIKEKQVPHQKLPENYFQNLPLNIQKMLIETNPLFRTLISNLHPSLKDSLYNLKNIGLF